MHRSEFVLVATRQLGLQRAAVIGVLALLLTSCSSGPARVNQAYIDPSGAGDAAIELYDSNGDGQIAGEELDKVPGIKAALPKMDTDGNKGITADEIAERIRKYQEMRVGLISFGFTATLDGKPLEGATVTFEPEPFIGDEVKAAVSVTDEFGSGGPSVPKEQRPTPETPPGVSLGIYKVRISKQVGGQEIIPAKYNTETTLGAEVAPDVSEILNRRMNFVMTTK